MPLESPPLPWDVLPVLFDDEAVVALVEVDAPPLPWAALPVSVDVEVDVSPPLVTDGVLPVPLTLAPGPEGPAPPAPAVPPGSVSPPLQALSSKAVTHERKPNVRCEILPHDTVDRPA